MKYLIFRVLAYTLFLLLPEQAPAASQTSELIPAQMVMPSSWGLIKLFLLLTFYIHIVLVSILLGSVMLAAAQVWCPAPGLNFGLKKDSSFVTGVLALAVNFGVAPLLFAQVAYGSFLYTSSVLMALWWLCVPLLVIFAYYGLYIIKAAEPESPLQKRLVITLIAFLLMSVAFLLTNNSTLTINPKSWVSWADKPGGTLLNLGDPTLLPRYLHMLTAALAVGGLFMALRARWGLRKAGADQHEAERRIKYGLNCFIVASLVQAGLGLWFLFSLPESVRALFLGGSPAAMFSLGLVVFGLAGAILAARNGSLRLTAAFALGIIFIMVVVRDFVRMVMLSPYNQETLQAAAAEEADFLPQLARQAVELPLPAPLGQGAALAIFIICALMGAASITWLLRVVFKSFNRVARPTAAGKGE